MVSHLTAFLDGPFLDQGAESNYLNRLLSLEPGYAVPQNVGAKTHKITCPIQRM